MNDRSATSDQCWLGVHFRNVKVMDRAILKTPQRDVLATQQHVLELLREAAPRRKDRALFVHLMNEASANGLTWIEALEFVVACRRSLPWAA